MVAHGIDRSPLGRVPPSGASQGQREAYLAFVMDERRAGQAIKGAGGGPGGAAAVLVRHLRALTSSISGADLQVDGWLGPRDLAEVIRTADDPHSARTLAERRASANATVVDRDTAGLAPGVDPGVAEPRRLRRLRRLRGDNTGIHLYCLNRGLYGDCQ